MGTPFWNVYGQTKKMQAKCPTVSPGAFLAYHTGKLKPSVWVKGNSTSRVASYTVQSCKWLNSDFVNGFKSWNGEKYEACREKQEEESKSSTSLPSRWDSLHYGLWRMPVWYCPQVGGLVVSFLWCRGGASDSGNAAECRPMAPEDTKFLFFDLLLKWYTGLKSTTTMVPKVKKQTKDWVKGNPVCSGSLRMNTAS